MRAILLIGALTLAACQPAAAPDGVHANGCAASADAPWTAAELRIEAASSGPGCAEASASLSVKDASGATLWRADYPTSQVMSLVTAQDVSAMRTALREWIDPAASPFATTAGLPVWADGAESPVHGEFAFYVEDGVDRARYEALRAHALPIYCFVQGMESMACLAREDGAVFLIGAQTFPG